MLIILKNTADFFIGLEHKVCKRENLKVPRLQQPVKMKHENKIFMTRWESINNVSARQKMIKKISNKGKVGAFPEQYYHDELRPSQSTKLRKERILVILRK